MNYEKIYYDLVLSAKLYPKESDYYENHHIKPRSMGGSDDESNLVKFTGRQHYIAHWLLYKIYKNKQMAAAWNRMCSKSNNQMRYNSHTYSYAREALAIEMSKSHSGKGNPMYGTTSPFLGKKHTPKTLEKMSNAAKGKSPSKETREKLSRASAGKNNPNYGKKHTNEIKEKMKEAWRERKEKQANESPASQLF